MAKKKKKFKILKVLKPSNLSIIKGSNFDITPQKKIFEISSVENFSINEICSTLNTSVCDDDYSKNLNQVCFNNMMGSNFSNMAWNNFTLCKLTNVCQSLCNYIRYIHTILGANNVNGFNM